MNSSITVTRWRISFSERCVMLSENGVKKRGEASAHKSVNHSAELKAVKLEVQGEFWEKRPKNAQRLKKDSRYHI